MMNLLPSSTANSKKFHPPKRVRSLLAMALPIILWISIQACNSNECEKIFVKKSTTPGGEDYQSETLLINLPGPGNDSLSCYAFKNLNGEIKLTFLSSSDYRHFSDENGDSLLVILYGSVPKDTLIHYLVSIDKEPGTKFKGITTFRMEDALAADIIAKKRDNQINFVLGSYKFALSDEMYCTLKQVLNSKL